MQADLQAYFLGANLALESNNSKQIGITNVPNYEGTMHYSCSTQTTVH